MKSIWSYPQVLLNFYISRLAGVQKPGCCENTSYSLLKQQKTRFLALAINLK